MNRSPLHRVIVGCVLTASLFTVAFTLAACGGGASTASTTTVVTPAPVSNAACALTANTKASSTVTNGCALLVRDTSSCQSARQAEGLSGAWLKFSCRVNLSVVTNNGQKYVEVSTDSQPDYLSNYFGSSNACYTAYTPKSPDPNTISAQTIVADIPLTPTAGQQSMNLGVVGVALNGVAIFDNQAAPGDDIYTESGSFDQCQGHPQQSGIYHYHTEPYAISSDDSNLIGVLRDGYFVYGRLDADQTTPTLDADGGHTGNTPDSPATAVYHYHLNLQTSTSPGTAGKTAYFLTTGKYHGAPGTCTGC